METLPPVPPVSPVLAAPSVQEPEQPYFSVSLLKLGILSVLTLGLYELYWMFQNWKRVAKRKNEKMQPFWRAFFGFFFIYALLKEIRTSLEAADPEAAKDKLQAGPLAVAWIIITLLYKLPGPLMTLSWLSFIPLLVVQARVNKLNALVAPGSPVNSKFTWANWIWIVLGGIVVVLAVVGSFLPDTPDSN